MELFLVRHTETEQNGEARCIGQTDVPLSEAGKQHIHLVSARLVALKPECVITSDMERCIALAQSIASQLGLEPELSRAWREVNFGQWENRSWDDIERRDSIAFQAWMNDFVRVTPPDGESFQSLHYRISLQMDLLLQRPEERFVVVTHAGPIRAALCYAIGLPLQRAFSIDVAFGGIVHLQHQNGQWSLHGLNN
ncbi:MAG: alpha-ribazole phosphatase [Chloroherpetonaceae bacterium]|nr:alpha-ribazole phosphatase [Chloroherpetonaceae bacterium]MCS7212056.1 alpha-ribazole phosphatase [Chloroherpetonaceae bacterium]MDW8018513.1 alpha-ribazole phosphatase [Chloroherpetonaceae bacterium]